jgi:hypothetical protein
LVKIWSYANGISTNRCEQHLPTPALGFLLAHFNQKFVSLAAHKAFIIPPEKSEILKPQEGLVDFNWMLHILISSMSNVPLDATVMAISRLHVTGEYVTEFTRITQMYLHLVEASKPPPLMKVALRRRT